MKLETNSIEIRCSWFFLYPPVVTFSLLVTMNVAHSTAWHSLANTDPFTIKTPPNQPDGTHLTSPLW